MLLVTPITDTFMEERDVFEIRGWIEEERSRMEEKEEEQEEEEGSGGVKDGGEGAGGEGGGAGFPLGWRSPAAK